MPMPTVMQLTNTTSPAAINWTTVSPCIYLSARNATTGLAGLPLGLPGLATTTASIPIHRKQRIVDAAIEVFANLLDQVGRLVTDISRLPVRQHAQLALGHQRFEVLVGDILEAVGVIAKESGKFATVFVLIHRVYNHVRCDCRIAVGVFKGELILVDHLLLLVKK
jgi:hypothetical protein